MVSSHDFDGAIQYLQSASDQQPNVLVRPALLAHEFSSETLSEPSAVPCRIIHEAR